MVGSRCPPISEVHGLASHGQAVPLLYFCTKQLVGTVKKVSCHPSAAPFADEGSAFAFLKP
jgi:hypothetical protein